jgi:rod shape-determining protein MreC
MNVSTKVSINKKNSSLPKFLIGVLALLFFIAILNFFGAGLKNAFYGLSSPVQKTFWTAGESCSGFLSSFLNAGNLSKDNLKLENQIQRLQAQLASLQTVISGNQAQSTVSLACQNDEFNLLMAGVIGLDDQDVISINKGSEDGVLENMPVINQQGALYGKVFQVYKNFSKVMLISNKNSVINVKVQQQCTDDVLVSPDDVTQIIVEPDQPTVDLPQVVQAKEIDGVVKGGGNLIAYLDLVPIDDTINEGDTLTTSALEGTFPKDLLVGTIIKVQKNDQNPHQSSQVQLFLSSSTDNLFVITNYKR